MKVNVISESAFTVQGHGVHTAFTETVAALRDHSDADVEANTGRPADVVHVHTIGPYSLYKLLRARGARVVSAHVTPDSFVGSLVGAKYWYGAAKLYLRWFYNLADGVMAVSDEVVQELGKMGVRKPVFLVPNTISTRPFATTPELRAAARKHLRIPEETFVVLGNGQVQPRKRIDVFVSCAKRLPDVHFVWVGGMPFKKLAADSGGMTEAMEHHPKNLRFTGMIKREDVMAYYHAADLFLLPSTQETFGIVIVEAAAAGLPIILRDIDLYRTTFAGGYVAGNDETFSELIEKFTTDKAYYKHWQEASDSIAKKYNSEAGARRLMEVYGQVIAARKQKLAHK